MLDLNAPARSETASSASAPAGGGNGEVGGNGDASHAGAAHAAPGLDAAARRQLLDEPILDADDARVGARRDGSVTPEFTEAPLAALAPAVVNRRLLAPGDREPLWKRWLFVAAAITLAYAHFYFVTSFWGPAHWGNNHNGYLVGAKNLANSLTSGKLTSGFEPASPFEFVGWMWVMAQENPAAPGGGMHYPKYPIGLPLVDAIVYRIGLATVGADRAIEWVFLVSPVAMSLALLGTFFLTRRLASSFAGILAMILLGTLPLTLILANNPNSHALSLCFICWGMYATVRWWETLSWWRGLIAGFLLGYAVTIRYTEGLLLLPLALAGLLAVTYRPRWLVSWWRVGAWALFACAAFVIHDSLGQTTFAWQQWLTTKIGPNLAWWHRALLIALPLVITLRWTLLGRLFRRETIGDVILGGEWLRALACALVVLAASIVSIPQLETTTPPWLHVARLALAASGFATLVVLFHTIRWRELRTWAPSATLAVGWLLPVGFLLAFNKLTVGTLTGYDTTNESTGFTYKTFMNKWQDTLTQLYNQGLYFILPVALVGLVMAFRWSWRAALLLLLWFVPGTLLYMAYYYGRGMPLIGYLRFFTSMLPAAVVAAVWMVHKASADARARDAALAELSDPRPRRWWWGGSVAAPLAAGVFVAIPASMNVNNMLGSLERDGVIANNLADVGRRARQSIPDNAIVFGHSQRLLNYLQFAGKDSWKYYGADYFRNGFPVPHMGSNDPDQPNPIQPWRKNFLKKAYDGLDNADMVKAQNEIMANALQAGQRVFLVRESSQVSAFRRAFLPASKWETKTAQKWTDMAKLSPLASRSLASLGADVAGRGSAVKWEIIEVTKKPDPPPKPQPATQPTTPPAHQVASVAPATQPATQPTAQVPDFIQDMVDELKSKKR